MKISIHKMENKNKHENSGRKTMLIFNNKNLWYEVICYNKESMNGKEAMLERKKKK